MRLFQLTPRNTQPNWELVRGLRIGQSHNNLNSEFCFCWGKTNWIYCKFYKYKFESSKKGLTGPGPGFMCWKWTLNYENSTTATDRTDIMSSRLIRATSQQKLNVTINTVTLGFCCSLAWIADCSSVAFYQWCFPVGLQNMAWFPGPARRWQTFTGDFYLFGRLQPLLRAASLLRQHWLTSPSLLCCICPRKTIYTSITDWPAEPGDVMWCNKLWTVAVDK